MNAKIIKAAGIIGAAAIAATVATGCGGQSETASSEGSSASPASQAASGGTMTFPYTNHTLEIVTTDPGVGYAGSTSVSTGVCETLFVLNDDASDVEPLLAESYEVIDSKTMKVTIRQGIKFHNGRDMSAESVVKALEYEAANNEAVPVVLDKISAEGQVVTITTKDDCAVLPKFLTDSSFLIFDTEAGDDYSHGLVGTGPFVFDSIDVDGNMTCVRNEDYWKGENARLEKIKTVATLDASAASQALQSGEIDLYSGVPTTDVPLFENNSDFNVQKYDTGRVYYLYLNPEYTFTGDESLREALQYAFDRESIVSGIYNGYGSVTQSIYPESSPFYTADAKQEAYDQNKANEILDKAGYKDTDGDGIREMDGKNIKLNITTYDANQFPKLCEALQQMLKAIGVDSEITISKEIMTDLNKNQFNIATYGYNTMTFGDCQNYLVPVYKNGEHSNFNHYNNAKVEKLLTELETTTDTARRQEIAKEVQAEIYNDNMHIYLMHVNQYTITSAKLGNYDATVFGGFRSNKLNMVTKSE